MIATARWTLIGLAATLTLSCFGVAVVFAQADDEPNAPSKSATAEPQRRFEVESLRGQVVWYQEALQQRLGIQTVPEAKQRVLALATKDDKLIPIIEDLRGRAFRTDPRLREMEVELMVPIAMDDGVRFAIREGGKTVGSGVVTKILD